MTETVEYTESGAILYDRSVMTEISDDRFDPSTWLHSESLSGELGSGGRGNTMYVGNIPRQFVLRHYRRGGLIGKLVSDLYVFTGADDTRPFREWRMLAKMADNGLRVPRPAAARFCRKGPFYTADLITVRVPDVIPLSVFLRKQAGSEMFWMNLGRGIQAFHAQGVYHADMNAHNLQIDKSGALWMLDFDRGELRTPGPWQQQTLQRLHRSLEKIKGLDPALHYEPQNWEQFLEGYFESSRSA